MRAAVVLAFAMLVPSVLAADDPVGDPLNGDPAYDLVRLDVAEDAEHVTFTLAVAGELFDWVSGIREYEIAFTVAPTLVPGVPSTGIVHRVGLTSTNDWGVFRLGSGNVLPTQPVRAGSELTLHVPKAYLDSAFVARPRPGDRLLSVTASAVELGVDMDTLEAGDYTLARDLDGGPVLHLRGDGTLSADAPSAAAPSAAVAAAGEMRPAAWTSGTLAEPLPLAGLGVHLWIVPTTSTPIVADEVLAIELWDLGLPETDGRRLVAERAEARSAVASENLFLLPGVPQRVAFAMSGDGVVPAGHRVELVVRTGGFLADESGPVVILCDAGAFDSVVASG